MEFTHGTDTMTVAQTASIEEVKDEEGMGFLHGGL